MQDETPLDPAMRIHATAQVTPDAPRKNARSPGKTVQQATSRAAVHSYLAPLEASIALKETMWNWVLNFKPEER